ncbi:MAG: hypothetical protein ACI841_000933 [Planctomycetota bacterium]|jgi:hypothetical protein
MTLTASKPIITGPTKTSRLGIVLTIDLTAGQSNMVIERGSTLPRASLIVTTAARRMIELSKDGQKCNTVAVVGSDLPPTAHPDLREITENVRALRDKWFPRAKLCFVSNGFDLESYDLRQTMTLYDRVYQDFHWGTAKTFSSLTGQKGPVLASLTRDLGGFDRLVVQARFASGDSGNASDGEIKGWIKRLQEVKPQEVQILTSAPASRKKVRPIQKNRQQEIAEQVTELTGLTVTIHADEVLVP